MDLSLRQVIYEPEDEITHVYFPETAMFSVVAHSRDGASTEVAEIGVEGAPGVSVALGSQTTPYGKIVQIAGTGYRMRAQDFRDEIDRGGPLLKLTLKFLNKLIIQISQTSLCNRLHPVDKRLSKWLLMRNDRLKSNELSVTQEYVAELLGTSRESITIAAIQLQKKGYIIHSRGKLTITDRPALEAFSCECYSVIKTAYTEHNE
ncbi:MAG TPA: Crp/Fnr family transcriptional regulator [Pyrinomonadaceae bacterium]|nr:Crp/Fnr family transcriptional regulator [Pyrinomonadaceae bacterium]